MPFLGHARRPSSALHSPHDPTPRAMHIAELVGPPAGELAKASRGELLGDPRLVASPAAPIKEWEDHIQAEILNSRLDTTSKKALITARVGQGRFKNNGSLLISPSADRESLAKMGVRDEDSAIIKPFSQRQQHHLEFHRDRIFASPQ